MILTLVRVRRERPMPALRLMPGSRNELEGFCRQLRLVSERDTDGTATTVVRVMLISGRGEPVGSSQLAAQARLNRVTVIHHLRRLEHLGVVEHRSHKYRLSMGSFSQLVGHMRRQQERMIEELEEMAHEIDREFLLDQDMSGIPLRMIRAGRSMVPLPSEPEPPAPARKRRPLHVAKNQK